MSYYPKETVSYLITFKDKDGQLLDPDAYPVTIRDPTGEAQQSPPTLSQVSTGVYELNWNLPTNAKEGDWKINIEATEGTYVSIHYITFTVITT